MNIPNRASCHHFMRRARSASLPVGDELPCNASEVPNGSAALLRKFPGSAAAASAELVPAIHPRRDVRFCIMSLSLCRRFQLLPARHGGGNTTPAAPRDNLRSGDASCWYWLLARRMIKFNIKNMYFE